MDYALPDLEALFERSHSRDWRHFPTCAQPCLLNKTNGYWADRCSRDEGGCCPGAKPQNVKHFDVWDCIQQGCDASHAQEAADLFLSDCAANGHALPSNFTLGVPSWFNGDRFPTQFEFKDFATPIDGVTISGFYGPGALLAWNIALIAAAISGLRSSPMVERHRMDESTSNFPRMMRVFRVVRRVFWYVRQDAELLAALAVPCLAAGDIYQRRRRVSHIQVFTYDHPSFVPKIYGEEAAQDVLTIRAGMVVISHFLSTAAAVASISWISPLIRQRLGLESQVQANDRGAVSRVFLRTISILISSIWCFLAVRPLFCNDTNPYLDIWYGGCEGINHFFRGLDMGSLSGVSCDPSMIRVPALIAAVVILIITSSSFFLSDFQQGPRDAKDWIELLVGLAVATAAATVLFIVNLYIGFFFLFWLVFMMFIRLPFLMVWYLLPTGRKCTFGPSNMIGFMEMDQIFTFAVAAGLGLASIWDSISSLVIEISQQETDSTV